MRQNGPYFSSKRILLVAAVKNHADGSLHKVGRSPAKAGIDRRELFIRLYLIHSNASRAYRDAGYKEGTGTRQSAHRLLTSAYIQDRLTEERQKHLLALDLEVDDLMRRYRDIAFADASQITAYRIGACRYCYGIAHAWQWRTAHEHQVAVEEATENAKNTRNSILKLPSIKSGTGYSSVVPPNRNCPECDGRGIPRVVFKDTRLLTQAERALFAGIEQTRHGLKYRFHDQMAALGALAKRLMP